VPPPVQLALDSLLADFKSHSQSIVAASQQQVQSELNGTVSELVRKLDSNLQRQLSEQHQHTVANSASIARLEQMVADLVRNQEHFFVGTVRSSQSSVDAQPAESIPG
jgi:DNA topoisomerase VI subunit B